MSGSGRFSYSAYVRFPAPPTVSTRLKRAEQDEETAQPKLFYSKVCFVSSSLSRHVEPLTLSRWGRVRLCGARG